MAAIQLSCLVCGRGPFTDAGGLTRHNKQHHIGTQCHWGGGCHFRCQGDQSPAAQDLEMQAHLLGHNGRAQVNTPVAGVSADDQKRYCHHPWCRGPHRQHNTDAKHNESIKRHLREVQKAADITAGGTNAPGGGVAAPGGPGLIPGPPGPPGPAPNAAPAIAPPAVPAPAPAPAPAAPLLPRPPTMNALEIAATSAVAVQGPVDPRLLDPRLFLP